MCLLLRISFSGICNLLVVLKFGARIDHVKSGKSKLNISIENIKRCVDLISRECALLRRKTDIFGANVNFKQMLE